MRTHKGTGRIHPRERGERERERVRERGERERENNDITPLPEFLL
jgi:hypothetical protein